MKKLGFILFSFALAIVFYACQTAESANEQAAPAASAIENTAAPTAPVAPPRPDYQTRAESLPATTVMFENEEFNYGKVTSGEKVTYKFKFTNDGSEPFEITNVKASCGCTTPDYSREPVAPGAQGHIDVEFDTKGKSGLQRKTITVTGNFDGSITKTLSITGEVLAAQ